MVKIVLTIAHESTGFVVMVKFWFTFMPHFKHHLRAICPPECNQQTGLLKINTVKKNNNANHCSANITKHNTYTEHTPTISGSFICLIFLLYSL